LIGAYTLAKDASGRKSRTISGIYGIMRVDEATGIGGTTDADLGTLAQPNQPTSYQYDLLGNLTQVNQEGQTRTFTYDYFNRIKTATNPESGLVQYTYDIFGNLKTKRDARGIKTIYDYDKFGRITTRCYRVIGTEYARCQLFLRRQRLNNHCEFCERKFNQSPKFCIANALHEF
jgi:YD repeat-containing protein